MYMLVVGVKVGHFVNSLSKFVIERPIFHLLGSSKKMIRYLRHFVDQKTNLRAAIIPSHIWMRSIK